MRRASAVSRALMIGIALAAMLSEAGHATALRQTAVITFDEPTWVTTTMLVGPYIIEHDDGRMARGEPCTVLYRVPKGLRRVDDVVSFHCIPRERPLARDFSTTVLQDDISGINTLIEYQFAGDSEAHGVPILTLAENRHFGTCHSRVNHDNAKAANADTTGH